MFSQDFIAESSTIDMTFSLEFPGNRIAGAIDIYTDSIGMRSGEEYDSTIRV
jgi:hypothetical protein